MAAAAPRRRVGASSASGVGDISRRLWSCLILSPLAILLSIWLFSAVQFLMLVGAPGDLDADKPDSPSALPHNNLRHKGRLGGADSKDTGRFRDRGAGGRYDQAAESARERYQSQHRAPMDRKEEVPIDRRIASRLLSRDARVRMHSSARGNLGPPSVLNQDPPGTDWIRDRWQAASDMGGTAIPGSHWVAMDLTGLLSRASDAVHMSKVVLDWEAAYAKDYLVQTRTAPPLHGRGSKQTHDEEDDGGWCTLYDGRLDDPHARDRDANDSNGQPRRVAVESGQSPGVKAKTPLHVVHTLDWSGADDAGDADGRDCRVARYLRVFVRKPARGWGVSLWQVDVYGAIADGGVG